MSLNQMKNKQWIAIAAVIVIGILLAMLIFNSKKPKAIDEAQEHSENDMQANADQHPKHGELGHDHEKDHLPQTAEPVEDNHHHDEQPQEIVKGPHGGKLFTEDGYGVEVTIFEQNVPPEFRIYTYQDAKQINPATSVISITLKRLGAAPQQFKFTRENNYLKGNAVVEEPHSFQVTINAKHNNQDYQFEYEQVEARVKVTNEQVLHNGIEVLTAGPAKIKTTLHLQGEIKLNADKSVHILSRVGGVVEKVTANAGDKIRKGQVLASISSQSVADMRSDLLAAQKRLSLARITYAREKQLWEEKISAQQDYLQAQHDLQEAEINANRIEQKLSILGAGSKGQAYYEIRSPIDGVITNKQISQGQVISEIDNLFEVADLSTVWVEMTIYAKDINAVKAGQKVTVKASAFDAQTVGTIAYVGALVGEQSRTAMARVVISNASRTWLPGLPVNVDLISEEIEVPLAVSLEGIQTLSDWSVVFGRYGEFFEARPLALGRRDGQYVEVLEGLKAGEQYAAGNSFLIKADIGKAGATHDH